MTTIFIDVLRRHTAGLSLCIILGILAVVISRITSLPVMMLALMLGLCLGRFSAHPYLEYGVSWASEKLLYLGVALLGLRIDIADLADVGISAAAFVILLLLATIAFGFMISRLLGENKQFCFLIGGSVAICGASAAAAICAVMSECENRDRELAITIAGITALSTIAMIFYPFVSHTLDLSAAEAGLFIGGSIHNVSQAVGAGYSVSNEAGDATVILKMLRVSMLLPIILLVSLLTASAANVNALTSRRTIFRYFPPFLVAFLVLVVLSCFNLVPNTIASVGNAAAKWALIISLAAIGMKTDLRDIIKYGKKPLLAMTLTTLFMACTVLAGIYFGRQF